MKIYLIKSYSRYFSALQFRAAVVIAKDKKQAKQLADKVEITEPYRVNYLGEGKGVARILITES